MSVKKKIYERNLFFLLQKISFSVLGKLLFFFNFLEFNCLGIFIAEANTIKWRYVSAKASAFVDCRGEFWTLHHSIIEIEFSWFNKHSWGFRKCCEPTNGRVSGRSSLENFLEFLLKLVAKLLCGTSKQVCLSES